MALSRRDTHPVYAALEQAERNNAAWRAKDEAERRVIGSLLRPEGAFLMGQHARIVFDDDADPETIETLRRVCDL